MNLSRVPPNLNTISAIADKYSFSITARCIGSILSASSPKSLRSEKNMVIGRRFRSLIISVRPRARFRRSEEPNSDRVGGASRSLARSAGLLTLRKNIRRMTKSDKHPAGILFSIASIANAYYAQKSFPAVLPEIERHGRVHLDLIPQNDVKIPFQLYLHWTISLPYSTRDRVTIGNILCDARAKFVYTKRSQSFQQRLFVLNTDNLIVK